MIKARISGALLAASLVLALTPPLAAQNDESPAEEGQDFLKVFFDTGSSRIDRDQQDVLDQAARTFRDGNPFVMILTGVADTVGDPADNLDLSLRRADAVADALTARGIPADRLQVLGRGNSELEVETGDETPAEGNRVVEISWR